MANVRLVVPLYVNHESLYPVVEQFFDSLDLFYPTLERIVVDDDSPLVHPFPARLRNEMNLGFTQTVNRGLQLAFGDGAQVVMVANDDLTVKPGDLDRFFDLDPIQPIIASPCDTASDATDRWGAIWGITRAAYDVLGPLDERYKHYFSDKAYHDRARQKGVTIIKWRDIVVEHMESATYMHTDKAALLAADEETYGASRAHPAES